jgi:hypothetical protein
MIKHRVTSTASIPPVIFQQSCDLATRSLARKRARLRAESDREALKENEEKKQSFAPLRRK